MMLNLVHARLDMRRFNRWAGHRGLMRRGTFDSGYAFHILLSAMFGKGVLQPFRLFASERRRSAALYAYSNEDEASLRRRAGFAAPPDCEEVVDPRCLRSKPMPADFEKGQHLGFDLRLRPVRRLRNDLPDPQVGSSLSKGSEVDAFRLESLSSCPTGPRKRGERAIGSTGITRESVYRGWLAERLGDTAAVDQCKLAAFQRTRVVRGNNGGPEGPDAILHGTMTVTNPDEFARLLRKGVGRHRAYGYGMLLLRPPGRPAPER